MAFVIDILRSGLLLDDAFSLDMYIVESERLRGLCKRTGPSEE